MLCEIESIKLRRDSEPAKQILDRVGGKLLIETLNFD